MAAHASPDGGPGAAPHAAGFHPHAPRFAIRSVLFLLAVGAICAGLPTYLTMTGQSKENWVQGMVAHSSAALGAGLEEAHGGAAAHADHPHLLGMPGHTAMFVLSTAVGLTGIFIAFILHLANRRLADRLRGAMLARGWIRWLPIAMEHKWYVDEIYHACFRLPAWILGRFLHLVDRELIDGLLVNGGGRVPVLLGRLFQPLYNGALQGYATTMAGAIVLIMALIVLRWVIGGMA